MALAASLALHLALLALLLSRRTAPPRGPVAPIEVELVHAAPPEPRPPRRAAPAPGAPRRPAPERKVAVVPRSAPLAPPPADHPFRGTMLEGLAAPSERRPDLSVRWRDALPNSGDEPDARDEQAVGESTEAPGARLQAWLAEQAGRDRVENGLFHPYYGELGRSLLAAWDAERPIRRHGLPGYLAQVGENVRTFLRVWQKMAEGYAKTGAPSGIDGGSERVKQLAALPPGPGRDSLLAAEIGRQLRPAWSEGRVTLVRVTQAADGKLLSVELVSPSSSEEVDRAAIEDVRRAAERLPVPPDEARAGREKLVTLWELELEVSITPPLPVVTVEFDEVLGLADLRLPLDRRIWKRVRLVAVL